jgi:hypothetical protein
MFIQKRETTKVNEFDRQEIRSACLDLIVQLDRMWQQLHGQLVSNLGTVIDTKYESDALPHLIASVMRGQYEPQKFERVRLVLEAEHFDDFQLEPFLKTLAHLQTLCSENDIVPA